MLGGDARTLLDDLMPACDVRSRHSIWIDASPDLVYEIARSVDLGRPWLVRLLAGLRTAPAVFALRARANRHIRYPITNQRSLGAIPFTLVAEKVGEEFVLGIRGRFWTLTGGLVVASPEQLRAEPPHGHAQALWNFRVRPAGSGTELSTETRIRCGDPISQQKFRRYWAFVRLGSSLIRLSMLRHVRQVAKRRGAHLAP